MPGTSRRGVKTTERALVARRGWRIPLGPQWSRFGFGSDGRNPMTESACGQLWYTLASGERLGPLRL